MQYSSSAAKLLDEFAAQKKGFVTAQYLSERRRFERSIASTRSEATITEEALLEFEGRWQDPNSRLEMIPGKEALAAVNQHLQEQYGISITPTAILDAMTATEVAEEMQSLIRDISGFASSKVK
jgi:hypothetical protein